ncbi:suppressor-of-stellate-like protein [Drosophila mauritiana]|uniref:Suppressor-of-stellate-like protein n=1 Tax=Drosophila mauritiana TaxID=7226 RepID=A0A6P8LDJ6_DROMA|nr:suppressor-of-stellate-like protein [Drosophila mauritiana]
MFGTSFSHNFFAQRPNLRPQPPLDVPRLFGFRFLRDGLDEALIARVLSQEYRILGR